MAEIAQQSDPTPPDGILLVGHGTRDAAGQAGLLSTATELAGRVPHLAVEAGFLELAEPSITAALARLAARRVERIVVVPVLLFAAGHAKEDIPRAVADGAAIHRIRVCGQTQPLEWHPALVELVAQRTRAAWAASPQIPLDDTLWLLVGRGSGDPAAGNNLNALAARVAARLGVRHWQTAFYALAQPRYEAALRAAAQRSARRIVVQPHFLYAGQLPAKVMATATAFGRQSPGQDWRVAEVLGPDPLLVEALLGRLAEWGLMGASIPPSPASESHPPLAGRRGAC